MTAAIISVAVFAVALLGIGTTLVLALLSARSQLAEANTMKEAHARNATSFQMQLRQEKEDHARTKAEWTATAAALKVARARAVHGLTDGELRDALDRVPANQGGQGGGADPVAASGAPAVPGPRPARKTGAKK